MIVLLLVAVVCAVQPISSTTDALMCRRAVLAQGRRCGMCLFSLLQIVHRLVKH